MELNVSEAQAQQQHQTNNDQQQQQQSNQQQQTQQQQPNQQPPYTMAGILHYLQYEWHRVEVERQEWEVEKAELSARIALLQGEKKSHENLKHDLIRRIKMLEYCLRMERAKYHKLKHGTDPPPIEGINQTLQGEDDVQKSQNDDGFINSNSNNPSTVTYGRELLRHYLQEIGYTDTIIDLRSNRVRSLLGFVDNQTNSNQQQQSQQSQQQTQNSQLTNPASTNNNSNEQKSNNPGNMTTTNRNNSLETTNKKGPFNPALLSNNTNKQPGDVGDAEASVLATFGFLYDHEGMKEAYFQDEEEEEISDDVVDAADRAASTSTSEYSYITKECSEAVAMIRQKLDLLNNGKTPTVTGNSSSVDSQKDINRLNASDKSQPRASTNAKNWCPSPQKSDVVDIGELATLTTLGSETTVDDYRRKQWTAKYRLQSHYDCVRALRFSETDSLLVTASEDETIKLWHLSRQFSNSSKSRQPNLPPSINAISSLEGSTLDIEPLHTYRGHTSRILSITLTKDHIFSGAQNGELIMWEIISEPSTADQYGKFDPFLLICKFVGHDDAIWSVETIDQPKSEALLCSASADLTIKIWNTSGKNKEPIGVINLDSSPTCIAKMPLYNVCQADADIAVSFCDGKIRLYDIASCLNENESNTQPLATFECDGSYRINSIVIHPTLSYMASADSNRDIKFWDLKTRKCKSTMVAHLDEVTSLACDPTGKYLLSASHDCSVRLWLFEEKACIQEITSHRKKFDEGIFAVAFHPSLSHFATAGADGLAKVFV